MFVIHDDVIKWKYFPRNWLFVRGIHRSPLNSPHKGQWRGALMFSLICTWINGWVNNPKAGDLRRHRAHCDVSVMTNTSKLFQTPNSCSDTWRLTSFNYVAVYHLCILFLSTYLSTYLLSWSADVHCPVINCITDMHTPLTVGTQ